MLVIESIELEDAIVPRVEEISHPEIEIPLVEVGGEEVEELNNLEELMIF